MAPQSAHRCRSKRPRTRRIDLQCNKCQFAIASAAMFGFGANWVRFIPAKGHPPHALPWIAARMTWSHCADRALSLRSSLSIHNQAASHVTWSSCQRQPMLLQYSRRPSACNSCGNFSCSRRTLNTSRNMSSSSCMAPTSAVCCRAISMILSPLLNSAHNVIVIYGGTVLSADSVSIVEYAISRRSASSGCANVIRWHSSPGIRGPGPGFAGLRYRQTHQVIPVANIRYTA